MDSKIREFVMSSEELDLLRQLDSKNEAIAGLLRSVKRMPTGKFRVKFGRTEAEEVRTALTLLLAEVGFDSEYALTAPGKILEELIDRFHIG